MSEFFNCSPKSVFCNIANGVAKGIIEGSKGSREALTETGKALRDNKKTFATILTAPVWGPIVMATAPVTLGLTACGGGGSSSPTGTSNNPPQFTSTAPLTATVGVEYQYSVTAKDTENDTLSYYLKSRPEGMNINASTGHISWTPTANQTGNQQVIVAVSDKSSEVLQSFTISVSGALVNNPPVITSSAPTSAIVGKLFQYTVVANDPENSLLSISLSPTRPAGVSIDSKGVVSWTPTQDQVGTQQFTVYVSDGVNTTSQPISLTVNTEGVPANHAPLINSTGPTTATVGTPYRYSIFATDADYDTLFYSLSDPKITGMTIGLTSGEVNWTPTLSQVGTQQFTINVSDGKISTPQTTSVIVSNAVVVNHAPVFTSTTPTTAMAGTLYQYNASATDSDMGDTLTYSLTGAPTGMAITPSTGVITWTPTLAQLGDQSYTVNVSDSKQVVSQPVSLSVKSVPTPVTVSGRKIMVNGAPFTIKGVGYQPVPIGDSGSSIPLGDYYTANYSAIYDRDLPQLKAMNANTIRTWNWNVNADHNDFLSKCYSNGIYVIPSYAFDRKRIYDETYRQTALNDFRIMVEKNKDNPAILMWSFGNEVNEPTDTTRNTIWYSLLNDAAALAHQVEGSNRHPVTTANLEIGELSTYDSSVPNLDVWGANIYRGSTFGQLFDEFKSSSTKPFYISEFGIDAYCNNCSTPGEYSVISPLSDSQSDYAASLWSDIKAHNDIVSGGTYMAYSDEWWKGGSTTQHLASGYALASFPDGFSNEAYFGIMRVSKNGSSIDSIEPRQIFSTLKTLFGGGTVQPSTDYTTLSTAQLISNLDNGNWEVQYKSAKELFNRQDTANIELVRQKLVWPRIRNLTFTDGNAYKYDVNFIQLVQLGDVSAQPAIDNLKNPAANTDSRKWCAHLLGDVGTFNLVAPVLVTVFQDGANNYASWHQSEASIALNNLVIREASNIKATANVNTYINLLSSPSAANNYWNPTLRIFAAQVLGTIGNSSAAASLNAIVNGNYTAAEQSAARAALLKLQ